MSKKVLAFSSVVARVKAEIRKRLRRGVSKVSAVDFRNVMRGQADGSARGAVVRMAFAELVEERVLAPTTASVYNPDTKHRVTVYRAR